MKQLNLRLPFSDKDFVIFGSEKDQSVMRDLEVLGGYYEIHVMNLLSKLVKEDFICFDIGANIGIISLAMSLLAKNGKIYAFEASQKTARYFEMNMQENSVRNVELINLGISDRNEKVDFCYVERFAGGSFFSSLGIKDPGAEIEIIECITIDEFVKSNNIGKIDLIKMDIEGAEIKGLNGGVQTLRNLKPDLVIEINPLAIERFYGENVETLYSILDSIYPYKYLIDSQTANLLKIDDMKLFLKYLNSGRGVEDLFCSFKEVSQGLVQRT
jgi:FkbM family methyltransferase